MESTTQIADDAYLIGPEDLILITGATGFIGVKVVESLLERGFRNLRCFARPSSKTAELKALVGRYRGARIETVTGNLLSRDDCVTAARNAAVIIHLAAGTGQKSYADAFMNSVVTTRNLLEAAHADRCSAAFRQHQFVRRLQQPQQTHAAACWTKPAPSKTIRSFAVRPTASRRSSRTKSSPSTARSSGIPYVIRPAGVRLWSGAMTR